MKKKNLLITGARGYIGARLCESATNEGHGTREIDTQFYSHPSERGEIIDVRDCETLDVKGADCLIHLAALSHNPLANINEKITFDINESATIKLAKLAKREGVRHMIFLSTCSVYGDALDVERTCDENVSVNPSSAYGRSKFLAERGLKELACDSFKVTVLRAATVFGISPAMRTDLLPIDLILEAHFLRKINIRSSGSLIRPLIYIGDLCKIMIDAVNIADDLPPFLVVNVGFDHGTSTISEIAHTVATALEVEDVRESGVIGADLRSYRVSFSAMHRWFESAENLSGLNFGITEVSEWLRIGGLGYADLRSDQFVRLAKLDKLKDSGRLTNELRWNRNMQPEMPFVDSALSAVNRPRN